MKVIAKKPSEKLINTMLERYVELALIKLENDPDMYVEEKEDKK